jgi:iron(III) transport system substrate-binding protein
MFSPIDARRRPRRRTVGALLLVLVITLFASACGDQEPATDEPADDADGTDEAADGAADEPGAGGALTIYSGRSEELAGPILDRFSEETGIEVAVRYGDTAELAAQLMEEGENTPADIYWGQDAGALGALEDEGLFRELPGELLDQLEDRFRSPADGWVGTSGRARTIVYNTDEVTQDEVPDSILDLTDTEWEGRVGWAPTNGSFQAFVTAMRLELGEDETREWLEGMLDNDVQSYEKNTGILEAVGRGEVHLGLPNHYYLFQLRAEDPDLPVENSFPSGDIGSLINVAGLGVLETTDQPDAAEQLVEYLLSAEAQEYFAQETYEYPLIDGVEPYEGLPALDEIESPGVDLSQLDDLEGTLQLLRETGALQ